MSDNGHHLNGDGGEGGFQLHVEHAGGQQAGADRALVQRAIKRRWPVADVVKRRLMAQVAQALRTPQNPRAIAQLGRIVVAAEAQNQSDDHLAVRFATGTLDGTPPTVQIVYEQRKELPRDDDDD